MSSQELESDTYDVIVIGTGLAESIAAAALAKAGKTILHLDPNEYYGSSQASLTLDELVTYTSSAPSSSSTPLTPALEADRRRYSLSLFPSILPSRGALIDVLIKSNVSKYVSFRMLDSVSIWGVDEGGLKRVPGSKEEVFKDKSVGLADKRKLMKFLMFAGGEFEGVELLQGKEDLPLMEFLQGSFGLPPHLAQSITFAIAHCSTASDATLPALRRTRRYLRSIGRYGPGAFLVGQYGGAGEVAQGFCRACAVFGGTYVLGPSARTESIQMEGDKVQLKIPCHSRTITAKHLISASTHLPSPLINSQESPGIMTAHCIAILPSLPEALRRQQLEDQAEGNEQDDTAVIVFPPEGNGQSVRAILNGEGTGSCPAGQFVLYLSTHVDSTTGQSPQEILQPYLSRLHPAPLFQSYRFVQTTSVHNRTPPSPIVLLDPYSGNEMSTEGMDWEAEQGEKAYWSVIGRSEGVQDFFKKREGEGEGEEDLDV